MKEKIIKVHHVIRQIKVQTIGQVKKLDGFAYD
jgi:hypothetical protein